MYKSNGRLNLVKILTKVTKTQGDHDGQRLRFVGYNWVVPLSAQFSLDLGAEMAEQLEIKVNLQRDEVQVADHTCHAAIY